MKANSKSTMKRKRLAPLPAQLQPPGPEGLPDPPVEIRDTPPTPLEISQREIVAYETALQAFRLAKADFELKRARLVLKLLELSVCEEGPFFALLDEKGNIVVENHTSLAPVTRQPVIDRSIVPSGGAA